MHKVKNAIILAAGRGSRLKDLTSETPKPLLAPKGIKFIDGVISNLKEKGIDDITVITGYHSDHFVYLSKQGINLIHNEEWDKGNNVTSIKAALNKLGDSLIINGDIIMEKNVFRVEYPNSLTYVEQNKNIDEWLTVIDNKGNVKTFDKEGLGKEGLYQREIIFITEELANAIKEDIKTFDMNEYQEFLMLKSAHRLNIPFKTLEIPKNTVYDLDTVEEYEAYKKS